MPCVCDFHAHKQPQYEKEEITIQQKPIGQTIPSTTSSKLLKYLISKEKISQQNNKNKMNKHSKMRKVEVKRMERRKEESMELNTIVVHLIHISQITKTKSKKKKKQ